MSKPKTTNGPNNKSLRSRRMASIHIALKQAKVCSCGEITFNNRCSICDNNARLSPMFDDQYRDFLFSLFKKRSCKDCTDSELSIVLKEFSNKGFVLQPGIAQNITQRKNGMLCQLANLARQIFGDDWESRLNGFCKDKFDLDSFGLLKTEQVTRCFAFLRGYKKSNG